MVSVAFYNLKGGVGKTAGCVNFAALAAAEGSKTLVWDLDPQGAATFYFKIQPKLKSGIKKLLTHDAGLTENIQTTEYENLDVIPADFSNRNLDMLLEELKSGKKRLKSLLNQLQGEYDYVFIDCPPGIGALSEALFSAADFIVLPTIPTTLSLRTFDMVKYFMHSNGQDESKLIGYFSMADIRKNLHNEVLEKFYKNKFFMKCYIPYLSAIEKMGVRIAPVVHFAPSSYASVCFIDAWKELKKRISN